MSAQLLSRNRETIVKCNGCGTSSTTGQTKKRAHREYLRTVGWGRGAVKATKKTLSTKRHDLCPTCIKADRVVADTQRQEANERRAARDEKRKARDQKFKPVAA